MQSLVLVRHRISSRKSPLLFHRIKIQSVISHFYSLTFLSLQKIVNQTFTEVIPNSQVVVIPNPISNPDRLVFTHDHYQKSKNGQFRWEMKLFVTPSRMILHTGIALGVTLIVITLVLTIQQYREKVDGRIFFSSSSQLFEYFIFRSKIIVNEKTNPNDFITMLYNPQYFHGQIQYFHLLFFSCFNDQIFFY